MEYKIDKNVPIPRKRGKWQEVASQMKKGDSIALDTIREKNGLYAAFRTMGIPVTIRREGSKFRIWRLK